MDDFLQRQLDLALGKIESFRAGTLALNALVQDLEALTQILGLSDDDIISDALADIEVINAFLIEERRKANDDESRDIAKYLCIIENSLRKAFVFP